MPEENDQIVNNTTSQHGRVDTGFQFNTNAPAFIPEASASRGRRGGGPNRRGSALRTEDRSRDQPITNSQKNDGPANRDQSGRDAERPSARGGRFKQSTPRNPTGQGGSQARQNGPNNRYGNDDNLNGQSNSQARQNGPNNRQMNNSNPNAQGGSQARQNGPNNRPRNENTVAQTTRKPTSTNDAGRGTPGSSGPQTNQRPKRKPGRKNKNDNFGPDVSLRDRLTRQLENDSYECTICSNIIRPFHKIWSCTQCYHLLHLTCAKKWASTDGAEKIDISWRCPTCNEMNRRFPDEYFCFCGKTKNPIQNRDELPHSCGGTCGRNRGPNCIHPCNELCHPGPCAECPVQVTRKCACGLTEMAVRCGTALQRQCETVCNRLLNCGIHVCATVCHSGPCQPCKVQVEHDCYCGGKKQMSYCGQVAAFSCGDICDGTYDCGLHKCSRKCHQKVDGSPGGCGPCPDSPERKQYCPCGRATVKSLLKGNERTSCDDPIPTCKSTCGKVLPCQSKGIQHRCESLCHNGPCPPCPLTTEMVCKCQRSKKSVPCKDFQADEVFECERVCKKTKSCGLHKCQNKCCREDAHICMQLCDKLLNCGKHRCERLCHPGQCFPCTHASFDEEFCLCRRTVYYPPIKCGDVLAECTYPCQREHACNHEVTHNCHREEQCPPCTVLTTKLCAGGHENRRNIPCHMENVSCGQPCGKPLRCEIHSCVKRCHRGECEKADAQCTRPCPRPRMDCEHKCNLPCHGTSPCAPSDCKEEMLVYCECGRRKEMLRCIDVTKNVDRLRAIRAEAEEERTLNNPGSMNVLRRSASMDRLKSLGCDSECGRAARVRSMAEALEIKVDENGDQLNVSPISYSDYLRYVMKNQPEFLLQVEKAFEDLVLRVNENTCDTLISHNFKPMRLEARRAIHEYATYFGLSSESVDSGAQRSVVVVAKKGIARAPLVTLSSFAARFPKKLNNTGPLEISSECIHALLKAKNTASIGTTDEPQLKPLETKLKAVRRRPPPVVSTTLAPLPVANPFDALAEPDVEPVDESLSSLHL